MKKKHIKKIIIVCVLACTLFVGLAVPSFAYTPDSSIKVWPDYVNTEDGSLNFYQAFKQLNNDHVFYDSETGYYRNSMIIKPTDFGNFATFNGMFSIRTLTTYEASPRGYDYELGFFDFTSSNRMQSVSVSSGTVYVEVFDVNAEYNYYADHGTFRDDTPYVLRDYLYQLRSDRLTPSLNEKSVHVYMKDGYFKEDRPMYLYINIFPNKDTAENISKYMFDQNSVLFNQLQIKTEEVEDLTTENFNLNAAISDLQNKYDAEVSKYWLLKENYDAMSVENAQMKENGGVISSLFAGIGQGLSNFFTPILDIGFLGISIGSVLTVAVIIFVIIIVLKFVIG